MSAYLAVLATHVCCALLTPWLFTARVYRASRGRNPAVGVLRWLPHTVDTALFGAGVTLALLLHISPLVHAWLAIKLVALLVYILIGHIAVRRVHNTAGRWTAWFAAVVTIGYIYTVALTKNPWPFGS